ncbi:hypothetical protein COY59_05210 [Candidatus Gottesmanbacteria bacterium CG_4_10_14_0_8_um_filter_37_24]|nr:MAG: hypothetical protein COX23_01875 [Candidatus Gottesmanbacteria bacterium CG23_combo_of_CG06-09_8_20_14_all_37_19]PIZ02385.1 MAG: hypothetical protein COY59_05210 [Candidatus Gottesmanbacteria bacterium CG_4_10_14_0_8_um_filter_37_24]
MKEQIIDNETTKVLVLTASQAEKMEADSEDDFKDEVCNRLNITKCNFLYSGWNSSNTYYVVIVKVLE